ncbi:uncharacterized protein LOC119604036 [Lucilia sericata]|uniref:uncharacterized protein LOC119604036 n=1 Tax=Lucilia sericata TaxID=13632 RepID=UPI0018A8014E|nr:uncharacterized protein LOC119604036 [Lucilia sericata]
MTNIEKCIKAQNIRSKNISQLLTQVISCKMKFAVFALIASLCLVAVTAKATGEFMFENEEIQEYEYIAQELADEIMEIEPQTIFNGMYYVLKKVLKTLNGVKCTIEEVLRIQVAAHTFLTDIAACGGEVSQKVQNLIDAVNDIIETCKAIIGISESVCANEQDTRGVVSGVKTSHKCAVNMLRKLLRLNKQIKRALKLIYQIKNVPGDTSKCVLDAVDNLEKYFTEFPANIKACSNIPSYQS